MANFLINYAFRFAVTSLNFLSPTLLTDIILHPFDFATVLLQIGFDPKGLKYEGATLVTVIVQYALFSFYLPYLLTSVQGLQFMGVAHPSIFYYVNYIYSKEGFRGCYRGLIPKICERLIMLCVSDKVKRTVNKDPGVTEATSFDDTFVHVLINNACSQFFAVLASHPFHVLMVSSFAEFTYNKKSTVFELTRSIYKDDGCFGFFTGLTARLLGELLSLVFSVTYTTIINKQERPQELLEDVPEPPLTDKSANEGVTYVTDISRFTAFKPKIEENDNDATPERTVPNVSIIQSRIAQFYLILVNFLKNITQNSSPRQMRRFRQTRIAGRNFPILAYIPLTSKFFYFIMIRDFVSRKIAGPFFLVSHCSIVMDSGWDKFPLFGYMEPLVRFVKNNLILCGRKKKKKIFFFSLYNNVPNACIR